jgi:hypothetical protein
LKQVLLKSNAWEVVNKSNMKKIGRYDIQNYLAYEYVALHPCTLSPRRARGRVFGNRRAWDLFSAR